MSRAPQGSSAIEEIRGSIERITFHNPENGYTVARLMPDKGRDLITIIGTFSSPIVGESLRCEGCWTRDPKWGLQLNVVHSETLRPSSAAAIEKYLGSGLVRGLGPIRAKRIVERFGAETLDIIDQHPSRLLEIDGIKDDLIGRIQDAWGQQREIRNIMVYLQSHGVSPLMADRIFKTYKDKAIEIVAANPYRLAYDVWGVGFTTADKIAHSIGIEQDDPRRIQAGLIYCMNQGVEKSGNVYLTREMLKKSASEIIGAEDIDGQLQTLIDAKLLVEEAVPLCEETAIYLPLMLGMERSVANRIAQLIGTVAEKPPVPGSIDRAISKLDIQLSSEQRDAVDVALSSRVMVLTGGPGTGKTTTTRAIIAALTSLKQNVQLASPTGRAAKRLSEVTGFDAVTIHRLLAYDPSTRMFQHGPNSPIECDVLLIDEASMLDLPLANAALRAVRDDSRVILVGDVDQLPSVGPGNVLCDLIDSGRVPVSRLTTIFRQAAQSMIVTNAHAINNGDMPQLPVPKVAEGDFVFVPADEADDVADKIVGVVARSLPNRYGIPTGDIQVLTPMQRGSAGAAYLNHRLQDAINPHNPDVPEIKRGDRLYRVRDRVIQLRNNYDKGIFNGDIGVVAEIDMGEETLTVRYPEVEIKYEFSDLEELSLAYALSIHKSQGSEFPAVVVAVHTQHYTMLQRQLIYTALTRAKRFAVIVGSVKAVAMSVRNDRSSRRLTCLKERLQGLM